MTQTAHHERHFNASEAVRDVVIGMADGLTVPFALAAGRHHRRASRDLGGCHSHGLGRISGLPERCRLLRQRAATRRAGDPLRPCRGGAGDLRRLHDQRDLCSGQPSGGRRLALQPVAQDDFMMRFEPGLETPEPWRAMVSAVIIDGSDWLQRRPS